MPGVQGESRGKREVMSDKNAYTCERCKQTVVTIDRVEGTTPMMIRCRATKGCQGMMMSSWYMNVPDIEPSFEWRKPTQQEYRKLSPAMKQHIDMGGLDLYPLAAAR